MSHLTRYYMYNNVSSCLNRHQLLPLTGKILGVSGIGNFYELIDCKNAEIIESYYPDVDMQDMPYRDSSFDCVVSDQVLEHIENPIRAVNESYRVLKRNGIAIHTSCFLNYFHPSPQDYWRFSPDGLRYLCKDFSKILISEGWGNRFAIVLCFISDKFRFMRIPEKKWSIRYRIATYKENRYPLVTWIVAQK